MLFKPLDPWQYAIHKEMSSGGYPLGNYRLDVGPGLPVATVSDRDGAPMGLLLGFALDLTARREIDGAWTAPCRRPEAGDLDAALREARATLGGRFLWLIPDGARLFVLPDASAQVPCVYDTRTGRAGSTAHALFDDDTYASRLDTALFERFGVDGEGWFPGGLTAHHDLYRLLPDHILELSTQDVRRFWSGPDATVDPSDAVDEIVEIIRTQIEAVLSGPKTPALSLTAGRETRAMLACARPYLDRIDFVTVTGGGRHEMDSVMARRIAREQGLRHRELPRVEATPEARALYIRRGGHCNADSNSHYHPSVHPIAQTHVLMTGLGGEIGRAFLWRERDTSATPITAAQLVGRMGLPPEPRLEARLEAWLGDLDTEDTLRILDLAYHEHRNGAWYAPQFPADPTLVRQAPLMTDRAVDLMMALPADWKRESRIGREIVQRLWPELDDYPYNSLGPVRDTVAKLRRAAADPRVILKKLRKIRA